MQALRIFDFLDKINKEVKPQDEITCFRFSETWPKHATPCLRYVYVLPKRENSSVRDSRSISRPFIPPVASYNFPSVIQWLIVHFSVLSEQQC